MNTHYRQSLELFDGPSEPMRQVDYVDAPFSARVQNNRNGVAYFPDNVIHGLKEQGQLARECQGGEADLDDLERDGYEVLAWLQVLDTVDEVFNLDRLDIQERDKEDDRRKAVARSVDSLEQLTSYPLLETCISDSGDIYFEAPVSPRNPETGEQIPFGSEDAYFKISTSGGASVTADFDQASDTENDLAHLADSLPVFDYDKSLRTTVTIPGLAPDAVEHWEDAIQTVDGNRGLYHRQIWAVNFSPKNILDRDLKEWLKPSEDETETAQQIREEFQEKAVKGSAEQIRGIGPVLEEAGISPISLIGRYPGKECPDVDSYGELADLVEEQREEPKAKGEVNGQEVYLKFGWISNPRIEDPEPSFAVSFWETSLDPKLREVHSFLESQELPYDPIQP